jgi:hypothetical protein
VSNDFKDVEANFLDQIEEKFEDHHVELIDMANFDF